MINSLIELARNLEITIPKESEFLSGNYIYKAFKNNDIKPLWNGETSTSFVIGLIINGKELKYPFDLEVFKKELTDV